MLRYAGGGNPNGSLRDIAGVVERAAATSFGLMPHPEHAVDPLTGSDRRRCGCSRSLAAAPGGGPGVTPPAAPALERLYEQADALGPDGRGVRAHPSSCSAASRTSSSWPSSRLLWSEHCAYKHSKKLLRTLPTGGERVLMGPGENAGAVDAGDGLAVVFKVESHNHPSAVEPFQGAATGVGGILRDVFALGARPVAVLDSLRFGDPRHARARATCSTGSWRASPPTGTRSACRPSAARSTSSRPTSRTAS